MATPDIMVDARASVFYPSPPQAATRLKNATLFTRIHMLATPLELKAALNNSPNIRNTFCFGHYSDVLVFDVVKEAHTTHVRAVLQTMEDRNLRGDIRRCAFDKLNWKDAGFYIRTVDPEKNAFMVLLREDMAPDAFDDMA